MKNSKRSIAMMLLLAVSFTNAQEENQKDHTIDVNKEAVLKVMKSYKNAIQNLTTDGTFELFTQDATVFEQGKVEGTYKEYINHHLGPELGHFKSFTFRL